MFIRSPGFLEYKKPKSWRYFHRELDKISIPSPDYPGWEYKEIDGLWFRVRYITVHDWYGRTSQEITERRSANKKEIAWIKKRILNS